MNNPSVETPPPAIGSPDRAQQPNLILGLIGGTIAMLLGAAVWGAITYFTKFQISWMAIGVGLLVGVAVKSLAKGNSLLLGLAAGVLALLGCVIGNLFFYCGIIARDYHLGFAAVLVKLVTDPAMLVDVFKAGFQFMDVVFYGIAIYVGFQAAYASPRGATVRPPA